MTTSLTNNYYLCSPLTLNSWVECLTTDIYESIAVILDISDKNDESEDLPVVSMSRSREFKSLSNKSLDSIRSSRSYSNESPSAYRMKTSEILQTPLKHEIKRNIPHAHGFDFLQRKQ